MGGLGVVECNDAAVDTGQLLWKLINAVRGFLHYIVYKNDKAMDRWDHALVGVLNIRHQHALTMEMKQVAL